METIPAREAGKGNTPPYLEGGCSRPSRRTIQKPKAMRGNTHTAAELVPEVIADFTRILLSEAASRHLSATGENCFAVVGKASWPDNPARWVLYLLPCSIAQADSAVRVARGLSTERNPKATPKL